MFQAMKRKQEWYNKIKSNISQSTKKTKQNKAVKDYQASQLTIHIRGRYLKFVEGDNRKFVLLAWDGRLH